MTSTGVEWRRGKGRSLGHSFASSLRHHNGGDAAHACWDGTREGERGGSQEGKHKRRAGSGEGKEGRKEGRFLTIAPTEGRDGNHELGIRGKREGRGGEEWLERGWRFGVQEGHMNFGPL